MMAQDMFEENKVLRKELDGVRSLIERWIPHMTSQMHDVDKMREEFEEGVQSLPSSEIDEEEEACEECGWWKPQCKCEEKKNG